jgi:hypothetical protein
MLIEGSACATSPDKQENPRPSRFLEDFAWKQGARLDLDEEVGVQDKFNR